VSWPNPSEMVVTEISYAEVSSYFFYFLQIFSKNILFECWCTCIAFVKVLRGKIANFPCFMLSTY